MGRKKMWLPPWEGPDSPQSPVPLADTEASCATAPTQDVSQDRNGRELHDGDGRVLSLGVDSQGGYAVPYQLDGTKTTRPKKRKP